MARRPSARSERAQAKVSDLNLTPIMNLIIILIPALLLSAAFVQTAVINVSAPILGNAVEEDPPEPRPEDALDLAVTITDQGFTVAGRGVSTTAADPTIPKAGDDYDFPALTERLLQLKDQYPEEASVTLHADPDVGYATLVRVMDASREAEGRALFPDVALSPGGE